MKRGLIAWDRAELPPSAFDMRLEKVRGILADTGRSALIVYSDIWRSNQARYLSNFMPYWNRALLAIPLEGDPILFCALSPRTYPWIRSVTILQDIRPGANLVQQVREVCAQKGWNRIVALDLERLPQDLHEAITASGIDVSDASWRTIHPGPDEYELSMYRRAARMAGEILEEELPLGVGMRDCEFAGRLERRLRRAGIEDLMILLSHAQAPPLPAAGNLLEKEFSATLALEYRGHWVKVTRSSTSAAASTSLESLFDEALRAAPCAHTASPLHVEVLSGLYPYEPAGEGTIENGTLFALQVETQWNGRRLFYGDTCLQTESGAKRL